MSLHNVEVCHLSYAQVCECVNEQDSLCLCDYAEGYDMLMRKGHNVIWVMNSENAHEASLCEEKISYVVEDYEEAEYDYYLKVWQRYAHIPWDILSTDRCFVKEMDVTDIDALYELYSDKSVCKYMEDLYADEDEELNYIRKYIENIYSYYGFGVWNIYRKEDSRLIGRAGYSFRPGLEYPEIGFMIGAPYQRMGYAYEVCSKILQLGYGQLGFDDVCALVKDGNEASIALLHKLGFTVNSKQPRYITDNEEYICMIKSKKISKE